MPKNPKKKGYLGMKGIFNPMAKQRTAASADISIPRALRNLGQSLNQRRAERQAEEEDTDITAGGADFDDGSGFGESCVFNEETGQVDCHGDVKEGVDVSGGGGKNAEKGGKSKGLGDVLIAMANRADKRKDIRSAKKDDTAKYLRDRSTLGSPYSDFRANMPLIQLLSRYYDRRAEMIKSRRSRIPN